MRGTCSKELFFVEGGLALLPGPRNEGAAWPFTAMNSPSGQSLWKQHSLRGWILTLLDPFQRPVGGRPMLVVVDYAMHYPKVVALQSSIAQVLARVLATTFSTCRFPSADPDRSRD